MINDSSAAPSPVETTPQWSEEDLRSLRRRHQCMRAFILVCALMPLVMCIAFPPPPSSFPDMWKIRAAGWAMMVFAGIRLVMSSRKMFFLTPLEKPSLWQVDICTASIAVCMAISFCGYAIATSQVATVNLNTLLELTR